MRIIKNERGFTLIELLIVIVIIGILAGVLVAVINPTQQQNRAKDAAVQATINKIALAVQGYVSAYGSAPFDREIIGSLSNATEFGTTCTNTASPGDAVCAFDIAGVALATAANDATTNACEAQAGIYRPQTTGAVSDCHFVYLRQSVTPADTGFKIGAKSFGKSESMFVYTSTNSKVLENCTNMTNNMAVDTC